MTRVIHASLCHLLTALSGLALLAGCASAPQQASSSPDPAAQSQEQLRQGSGRFAGILTKIPSPVASKKQTPPGDDLWERLRLGFDLPELHNERVAYYEKRFTRQPEHFYALIERAEWFMPYILSEVEKRGFPSEIALLPAVESAFITDAKSRSSASGLWQFIPSTGDLYDLRQDWWYDARRDPVLSTQAALQFLGELEQRFDGDWFHAIAAYNAGGWTVERAIQRNSKKRKPTHFNDLPLRRETRDYVPKLIAFRNIFLHPESYGLSLPSTGNEMRFASLDAGSQIDIMLFAQKAGLDGRTMRFLNSTYRRNITPPVGPHIIYLPADSLNKAERTLASLPRNDRLRWTHYRVARGDVLGRIASRHGVSVATIRQSNQLRSNLIHPGDILLIPVISGQGGSVVASAANRQDNKVTHHVRKGDTLWDIAQRYGVKVAQISEWNQISQGSTLSLGQKLTIFPQT